MNRQESYLKPQCYLIAFQRFNTQMDLLETIRLAILEFCTELSLEQEYFQLKNGGNNSKNILFSLIWQCILFCHTIYMGRFSISKKTQTLGLEYCVRHRPKCACQVAASQAIKKQCGCSLIRRSLFGFAVETELSLLYLSGRMESNALFCPEL